MNSFYTFLILLFSFSNLNAQNYSELLIKATRTENDSIKLMYLFDAATRVDNINEFHAIIPDIFSLITDVTQKISKGYFNLSLLN